MSEENNNDLISMYIEAIKTGDSELVKAALVKATKDAKLAMALSTDLAYKFTSAAKDHYRQVTEMPAVYSTDDTKNQLTASIAKSMGLGTEAPYNYAGDRIISLIPRIAVERSVEIIKGLRKEIDDNPSVLHKDSPLMGIEQVSKVLEKVSALPELNSSTVGNWSSAITEYAMTWEGVSRKDKAAYKSMSFPTDDLKTGSLKYAEARLESRRKKRLKSLEKEYPEYDQVEVRLKEGKELVGKEYVFLTNYQSERGIINGMQLDDDCWKYAIGRFVREKLERLLR
jgi:hypothetical protein|tara:strand:+ start:1681 stop:2532 length:852 start_codon:yes stop_codon:yes gene_type:complete